MEDLTKRCASCGTTSTSKWYSGPKCRNCFRKQPHIREKEKESTRNWQRKNKQYCKEKVDQWRKANPNKVIEHGALFYIKNKTNAAYRERKNKNAKELRKTDLNFRLSVNLRARLNKAIKNNQKSGSAVKDLGCSIDDLKKHLESLFQPGMSWDNYGEWHIDHINPLSSFDLTNKIEFRLACHYTNLQPLWAKDNIRKSNKD